MKTIAIFTNGEFPVPAVRGGSVANHIEYLINYNEEHPKFNFIVISMFDSEAKIKSRQYKYTKFIYINKKEIIFRIINGIRHEISKLYRLFFDEIYERGFIVESVRLLKKRAKTIDAILIKDKLNAAKYIRNHFPNIKIFSCAEYNYLNNELYKTKPGQVKAILENTDTIITVSDYLKEQISNIPIFNNFKCDIKTCYNGLILDKFIKNISESEKLELRKNLGFTRNDFVILFTGRLIKDKGVLELIKAFMPIQDKAKLLILGSNDFTNSKKTDYINELYNLVKNNDNIKFTGYISYSEIHKYYKIANLVVLPSLCEEAFNLSLLETMATKIPVIITKSGGMPEVTTNDGAIVIDKDENLIPNLTKSMLEIIIDYSKANNRVEIAFDRAKMLANEIYAKKMFEILDYYYSK